MTKRKTVAPKAWKQHWDAIVRELEGGQYPASAKGGWLLCYEIGRPQASSYSRMAMSSVSSVRPFAATIRMMVVMPLLVALR